MVSNKLTSLLSQSSTIYMSLTKAIFTRYILQLEFQYIPKTYYNNNEHIYNFKDDHRKKA